MVSQRDFLCQYIHVRCICDGFEVMVMYNPHNPRIQSDHPCISQIPDKTVIEYIRDKEIDKMIWAEVDRIHEEVKAHLAIREQTAKVEDKDTQKKKIKEQKKKKTENVQVRIIRM